MIIDATFWVAISFFIFLGILLYFKIPQTVIRTLSEKIEIIKNDIDSAEKLKDEAKNILSDYERKLSNSKNEVKLMIAKANESNEKTILKTNSDFHLQIENRRRNAEDRIKQMKNQAFKDVKNVSVRVSISAVEKLLKNSLDKSKLDKLFTKSIEETKLALKVKSS
tara:strand:- start:29 stop:526 length:498 start_codon:yes stop_codon:yes gene_type:complete